MLRAQVVVIGAGVSGLTLSKRLVQSGIDVLCIEKARGTGGRLSSKRIETDDYGVLSFDLGASSFHAASDVFIQQLTDSCEAMSHPHMHYVPKSRSSKLTRELANNVRLECGKRITHLEKKDGVWISYVDEHGKSVAFSQSEHLVLATPPEQAHNLLPSAHPYKASLEYVRTQPQWVSLFYISNEVFDQIGLNIAGPLLELNGSVIKRISVESRKFDRTDPEDGRGVLIKIEAQPTWTTSRTELGTDLIANELWGALMREFGLEGSDQQLSYLYQYTHRWLYSLPTVNMLTESLEHKNEYHLDPENGISLCGDYLGIRQDIDGVEAAFLSGMSLADVLENTLLAKAVIEGAKNNECCLV